jgi:adenosylcobinamide-phosphate synthase
LITWAEARMWRDSVATGGAVALGLVALASGAGAGLGSGLLATGVATYVAVGGRSLWQAAEGAAQALAAGDLTGGRISTGALVGRCTDNLGVEDLSRAVVESVAENTVDAIVAPLLWAAAGGPAAVAAYRAINTLDAMIGHQSAHYARFGRLSALADDLANWWPARLLHLLVTCRVIARAEARAHPSPNAGLAESAFAHRLGLRLGGPTGYSYGISERPWLNRAGRLPGPDDIQAAVSLSQAASRWVGLAVLVVGLAPLGRAGGSRGHR